MTQAAAQNAPRSSIRESYVGVSLWLRPSDLERLGHSHQIGQRSGAHLFHGVAAVDLYRDLAHAHFGRDLLVHEPGGHERHHFTLAYRQSLEATPQLREPL